MKLSHVKIISGFVIFFQPDIEGPAVHSSQYREIFDHFEQYSILQFDFEMDFF